MKVNSTRFRLLILAGIAVSFSSPAAKAETAWHFFDPAGNSLEKFEPVWTALHAEFGEHTPERIVVRITNDQFSRFDTRIDGVMIAARHYDLRAKKTIAHESAHLALHKLTNGFSTKNQFRFVDEGYATVFGNRVAGREVESKREILAIAAQQQRKNNVRIDLVQDWRTYWGNPRDGQRRQTPYAYSVAASFVHYLEDIYGSGSTLRLARAIGKTGDFDSATRLAFELTRGEIRAGWIAYLKNVRISESTTDPGVLKTVSIVRMEPPSGARDISLELEELFVEFDTDMKGNICIWTLTCDEICFRNARWKSPRLLTIKILNRLRPGEKYSLSLGIEGRCRLLSVGSGALPVTQWNFETSGN